MRINIGGAFRRFMLKREQTKQNRDWRRTQKAVEDELRTEMGKPQTPETKEKIKNLRNEYLQS